jgi:L-alanine-DL-glutamate epimerase-like enolase superfamily enzyme
MDVSTPAGPLIVSLTARVVSSTSGPPLATLSVGRFVGREIVLVTVTCEDGTVGYGEAFHGQAGSAVADVVNTVLQPVVVGRRPSATAEISQIVRRRYLASHGASSVFRLALSGIDMAMWDAHGKLLGQPVHRLLGGSSSSFPVYAGGFALGIQEPETLVDEARRLVDEGAWTALKLRIGESPESDLARVRAVREAFGDGMRVMVDANLGQAYDVGRIAGALGGLGVEWLEEPFERGFRWRYAALRARGVVPIAGGENLRGAEEFFDWATAGALDVAQPDASRVGGITEMLRIAAVAAAAGVRFVPHISHSVLNHAAALHVLSATGSLDLCEGDASPVNDFRDRIVRGGVVWRDGMGVLSDEPGLGAVVDEAAVEQALAGGDAGDDSA